MGYDMSIRKEVEPGNPKIIAALEKVLDALRDVDTVKRGTGYYLNNANAMFTQFNLWDEIYSHYLELKRPGYFRLNNQGMWRYLDAMLEVGMAHSTQSPVRSEDWPDYESFENDDDYRDAVDRVTGQHVGEYPTIPSHKFGSNDGWFVTPEEIEAALRVWDSYLDGMVTSSNFSTATHEVLNSDYWQRWIEYLRLAKDNGGFRVF